MGSRNGARLSLRKEPVILGAQTVPWLHCNPSRTLAAEWPDLPPLQNASDQGNAWTVNATFDAMTRANLSVVRTWTYSQMYN